MTLLTVLAAVLAGGELIKQLLFLLLILVVVWLVLVRLIGMNANIVYTVMGIIVIVWVIYAFFL